MSGCGDAHSLVTSVTAARAEDVDDALVVGVGGNEGPVSERPARLRWWWMRLTALCGHLIPNRADPRRLARAVEGLIVTRSQRT